MLSAFSLVSKMNRAILQTVEKQHNALCGKIHDVEASFRADQRHVFLSSLQYFSNTFLWIEYRHKGAKISVQQEILL